jgi:UDP-2,4-diacetamido-2,4,6-trideoxy-beta-L-altropyranose hydrolase
MSPVSLSPAGRRVVFRCDGNEEIGAGHVARCLPLADAFAQLSWHVSFLGTYRGLAGWLLGRAKFNVKAPDMDAPCGVTAKRCELAVLDSYAIMPSAICELAQTLPLVTLAEANRCPTDGVLLDYHLDRPEASSARLLGGPSFAPLSSALAGAGRAGKDVRSVLVSFGGSLQGRELLAQVAPIASSSFPDADILTTGEGKLETLGTNVPRVVELPSPSALIDILPKVDIAITAAGLTAYELACAGIPQVAIAITANQRRVVRGLRKRDLAPCLDLTSDNSLSDLPGELYRLHDPGLRRQLSERGMSIFDGNGAKRAVIALTELYR